MTRRGLAVGCGGTLGFAWTAIALQALERELPWDARTGELVAFGSAAGRAGRTRRRGTDYEPHGLDREVRALEAAGTKVIRVEPGPAELAATGLDLAADVVRDRRHGGDLELTGLP